LTRMVRRKEFAENDETKTVNEVHIIWLVGKTERQWWRDRRATEKEKKKPQKNLGGCQPQVCAECAFLGACGSKATEKKKEGGKEMKKPRRSRVGFRPWRENYPIFDKNGGGRRGREGGTPKTEQILPANSHTTTYEMQTSG